MVVITNRLDLGRLKKLKKLFCYSLKFLVRCPFSVFNPRHTLLFCVVKVTGPLEIAV